MTTPTVTIECESCSWRYDVPFESIGYCGGVPYALRHPSHDCPFGGESLLERAGFDSELVTTAPGWNAKLTL